MALTIKVHESTDDKGELVVPVIAIKFNDPEEASEQDYYLRDGWGHVVNTTIDGDTLYIEDTGMKVEKSSVIGSPTRTWTISMSMERLQRTFVASLKARSPKTLNGSRPPPSKSRRSKRKTFSP